MPPRKWPSLDTRDVKETRLPADLTNRFRASLLFVGPLLARFGRAWIQEVGGCTIGSRPTDYHYRGFARLGAEVQGVNGGGIDVMAKQLSGAFMYCDLPSQYWGGKPRYGVLPSRGRIRGSKTRLPTRRSSISRRFSQRWVPKSKESGRGKCILRELTGW